MKAPFYKKLKKALHQGKNGTDGLDRDHLLSNDCRITTITLEGKKYQVVNLGKVMPLLPNE